MNEIQNDSISSAEPSATPECLRAAVLDDYQHVANRFADWSIIGDRVKVQVFHDHVVERAALVTRLEPFDIVFLMRERTPLSAATLAALPRLKLIVTAGMWNAAIDLKAAAAAKIAVRGTQGKHNSTAELTWLLILALARRLVNEVASVRRGGWQTGVGIDLAGRTLGIVGLGAIGRQVAQVANVFGMTCIAWSPHLTDARAHEGGAQRVELDTLLQRADFVTVHMKLSRETRHLLGERELALMRPSAYLVNTSRGPLVSETALLAALQSGRIAGAAIDVYDVEPLPSNHPFRDCRNLIATPHIGYVTEAAYAGFFGQMVQNVRAWLDGCALRDIAADANPD
ncbi:MAG TPA: D-2-hydroxyacid dehydrogenase family protein [Casimicrobiaceae bacterium]|jgi:phosphoglycerate dehydrogenase-like enzyme|nr:D-2-hydroxyacid dehydrogenase family protein [Casimicrobiaceae bacterium]